MEIPKLNFLPVRERTGSPPKIPFDSIWKGPEIGGGIYGKIYRCGLKENPNLFYALKINRKFPKIQDFCGCLREIDIMSRMNSHPFILDMKAVAHGDVVTEGSEPIDKFSFVYELGQTDLYRLFNQPSNRSMTLFKLIMVQLLLGVEYMHKHSIIHRDLKPDNILYFSDRTVKICDFGLAKHYAEDSMASPRTCTAWYRSPENIFGNVDYDQKIDIFSLAMIFYEMLAVTPFFVGLPDNDQLLANILLSKHPDYPKQALLKRLNKFGSIKTAKCYSRTRNNWKNLINLAENEVKRFNRTSGSYDEFLDLLGHMARIDPLKRYDATTCLNHKFFKPFASYIKLIRKTYPVRRFIRHSPKPVKIKYRKNMVGQLKTIYRMKSRLHYLYQERVLTTAIDLFDRFLSSTKRTKIKDSFSDEEWHKIITFLCIYISFKYFNCGRGAGKFADFFVEGKNFDQRVIESLEYWLLSEIFLFEIYRGSIFDQYNQPISEEKRKDLVFSYFDRNIEGTYPVIARFLMCKQSGLPEFKPLVLKLILPKPITKPQSKPDITPATPIEELQVQFTKNINIKINLETTSDNNEVRSIRSPEAELVPVFNKFSLQN